MSNGHTLLAERGAAGLPDVLTVIAIALAATVAGDVIHEALGHGGACLATGGHASGAFFWFISIAIAIRGSWRRAARLRI